MNFLQHFSTGTAGARRCLNRLGPESADAIDEFLDAALNYDDGAPPSLTGFLAAMREGRREVKRDMDHGRNEVRVMTVHGAKGLEAPIVFLPDTCTTASGESPGARLVELTHVQCPAGMPSPILWAVKGHIWHRRRTTGAWRKREARPRRTQPVALRRHDARARPVVHCGI